MMLMIFLETLNIESGQIDPKGNRRVTKNNNLSRRQLRRTLLSSHETHRAVGPTCWSLAFREKTNVLFTRARVSGSMETQADMFFSRCFSVS